MTTQGAAEGRLKFLVCVDDSKDCRVALKFACMRAKSTHARVALLRVVAPPDFQHWARVGELMQQERRQEAEVLLQELAKEVNEITGSMPSLHVREGHKGEQVAALIEEDPSINIMVVGAAPEDEGSNELVKWLASQVTMRLRIPLLIVPGNMTDQQLQSLA